MPIFRTLIHRLLLLALPMLLAACSDDAPLAEAGERLVIEGHIDSGGYPDVLLNLTVSPSESGGDFADAVVRWGKVSISDGESEVVLTGAPSHSYFPPYHYYTSEMAGIPGRTYTITATYRDLTATSTVTMPQEIPVIERVDVTQADGSNDFCHVSLTFRTPDDAPAYYHLSAQVSDLDSRALPCMLGAVEAPQPGESVTVPVYRGRSAIAEGDYTPDFPLGAIVKINLERVTREVFDFWRAFDNASLTGGSIFITSPGTLPSNIAGGLGVWSAQAVASTIIPVYPTDLQPVNPSL